MRPTNQRIVNPTKPARLLAVLRPLLPTDVTFERSNQKKKFEARHETARRWSLERRITGALRPYSAYHTYLRDELPSLQGHNFIFVSGISPDQTDISGGFVPNRIGQDMLSERNRLGESLIRQVMYLHQRFGWNLFDKTHFVTVSPVISVMHVNSKYELQHSLESAIERTNAFYPGRALPIERRTLDQNRFVKGFYQFGEALFDSDKAKSFYAERILREVRAVQKGKEIEKVRMDDLERLFDDQETIMKLTDRDVYKKIQASAQFNRHLEALAIAEIAKIVGLEKITGYVMRTKYAKQILTLASKLSGLPYDDFGVKGIGRNADRSVLGECDPSALRLLRGRLYYLFNPEAMPVAAPMPLFDGIQQSVVERVVSKGGMVRPEICPEGQWYCAKAGECRHTPIPKNCTAQYFNNNFTMQDVRALLAEQGINDERTVREKYQELRFTEEEKRLIKEAGADTGRRLMNVKLHEIFLSGQNDEELVLLDDIHSSRSWIKFRGDRRVDELPIPAADPPEKYQVRPSEFSADCYIARALSSMDRDEIGKDAGIEVKRHPLGVRGTAEHKLILQTPYANPHNENLPPGNPKWKFTERPVSAKITNPDPAPGEPAEYTVFGHLDASFKLTDGNPDNDILLVGDQKLSKKGAYERPAYKVQTVLYGKGILQLLKRPELMKNGLGIALFKTFFHGAPDLDSFPEFSLGYTPDPDNISKRELDRDGKWRPVEGIDNLVMNSARRKAEALSSYDAMMDHVDMMEGLDKRGYANGCSGCFVKDACEALRLRMKVLGSAAQYQLPGADVVKA